MREEARRVLQDAGLRATAPRVAVLLHLWESARPVSHSEVVEHLGGGEWDQATLYRNLVKLVEAQLARVASQVGGVTRYAASRTQNEPHVHPHFACSDCGHVTCLPEARVHLPAEVGWHEALREAELQLVGRCPNCRKTEKKKRAP